MDAIGGYFELADYEQGKRFPHSDGILLNTGRNAFEYILRCIGVVKGVYLPYYTCEVVLEPLKKLHIPYSFYHINAKFEMVEDIQPKEREYIIANNYFGVKDAYIKILARKYGEHLIVDCAQAFFAKPIPGIKSFYSTRKYVGVADGGITYVGNLPKRCEVQISEVECTVDHDGHLYKRKQFGAEAGFADYQANEVKLDNQPIRWMSDTTKRILSHIDFDRVVARRRENYYFLHDAFAEKNSLKLPSFDSFVCPMVYPFLPKIDRDLRKELINNKVFVAKYWPNVQQQSNFDLEYELTNRLVAVPCDQRYGLEEMNKIIEIISNDF